MTARLPHVRVSCPPGIARKADVTYVDRAGVETDISDSVTRVEVDLTVGSVVRARLHVMAQLNELTALTADIVRPGDKETDEHLQVTRLLIGAGDTLLFQLPDGVDYSDELISRISEIANRLTPGRPFGVLGGGITVTVVARSEVAA